MRAVLLPAMKVVAWNIKGSRGLSRAGRRQVASEVSQLLTAEPLAFASLESLGSLAALRRALDGRYRKVSGRGVEGGSTRLYVSKLGVIRDRGLIRTKRVWFGPKGRPHRGRVFPWATIGCDGLRVTVVAVHLPWVGGRRFKARNERAYSECMAALADFAAHHDGPVVIVGDWNKTAAARGTATPHALARRIGGRVVETGGHIDYAITRSIRTHGITGRRGGSDHPPIAITLRSAR